MPIRNASAEDAAALLNIYAHYVENTAITFEYDVPTPEEFRRRIEKKTLEKYPYLVFQEGDEIVGYAYAGPFVGRAAYSRSCELSVYLTRDARGEGRGRALYEELERRLTTEAFLTFTPV